MKKRIILIVASFSVLTLAWLMYSLIAGVDVPGTKELDDQPMVQRPAGTGSLAGVMVGPGEDVVVYLADEQGRREGKYMARRWEKQGQEVVLEKPRFELYPKSGQTIYIEADNGTIIAEDSSRGTHLRRGNLRDNVLIAIDQNELPEALKAPREQRPGDFINIYVSQVEFDNELLEIYSQGQVKMYSRQANIFGEDLTITWNTAPNELRQLRLARGDRMEIFEGQDRLGLSVTGRATGSESAGSEATVSPASPATRPAAQVAGQAATRPGQASTRQSPIAVQPQDGQPQDGTSVYRVELIDNVKVASQSGYLHNADTLDLFFTYEREEREQPPVMAASPVATPSTARAVPANQARPSAPATRQATADRLSLPATNTAMPLATAPAQPVEPMVITWSGPMILTPVRQNAPELALGEYELRARGRNMVLGDAEGAAQCRQLTFRSEGQQGRLEGAPDAPVILTTSQGEQIVCSILRFSQDQGLIYLDGPGSMKMRNEDTMAAPVGRESQTPQPADSAEQTMSITWTDGVTAGFAATADQTVDQRQRQYLKSALFRGGVHVQQADGGYLKAEQLDVAFRRTETGRSSQIDRVIAEGGVRLEQAQGDFVLADHLDAVMAVSDAGKAYPREAIAVGNVIARQEGSEISAQRLKVEFDHVPEGDADRHVVRATRIEAHEDVAIHDAASQRRVRGQSLVSDAVARTAVITGSPAIIEEKDNRIQGNIVRLNENLQQADVEGPGKLLFVSDSDLSGNETSQPRPVEIQWAKGLQYRGLEDLALIEGQVELESEGDSIRCQTMRIVLEPAESAKSADAATADAPAAETRPAALAGAEMGNRRIKQFIAEGGALVESRRNDEEDGSLQLRRTITCDTIVYDRVTDTFDAVGKGTLLAEDYRPPEPKAPAARRTDNLDTQRVDRPSQTLFAWGSGMQYHQHNRTVELTGGVRMDHRSGNKLVQRERLPSQKWGEIEFGRHTTMDSDRLLVRFARAAETANETGPNVGALELFDAYGSQTSQVVMRDGPREAHGQRIVYDSSQDMAVIFGDTEGSRRRMASVYYEDPATGTSQSWTGAQVNWYRQNNRIVAHRSIGSGGR